MRNNYQNLVTRNFYGITYVCLVSVFVVYDNIVIMMNFNTIIAYFYNTNFGQLINIYSELITNL